MGGNRIRIGLATLASMLAVTSVFVTDAHADPDPTGTGTLLVTATPQLSHNINTYQELWLQTTQPIWHKTVQPWHQRTTQPWYQRTIQPVFTPGYAPVVHTHRTSLVTRLEYSDNTAAAVPTNGGFLEDATSTLSGHTYVHIDVAQARAPEGLRFPLGHTDPRLGNYLTPDSYNTPVGYSYNVRIVGDQLIVSFDNLVTANVGAEVILPGADWSNHLPIHTTDSARADLPDGYGATVWLYVHTLSGLSWNSYEPSGVIPLDDVITEEFVTTTESEDWAHDVVTSEWAQNEVIDTQLGNTLVDTTRVTKPITSCFVILAGGGVTLSTPLDTGTTPPDTGTATFAGLPAGGYTATLHCLGEKVARANAVIKPDSTTEVAFGAITFLDKDQSVTLPGRVYLHRTFPIKFDKPDVLPVQYEEDIVLPKQYLQPDIVLETICEPNRYVDCP